MQCAFSIVITTTAGLWDVGGDRVHGSQITKGVNDADLVLAGGEDFAGRGGGCVCCSSWAWRK